MSSRARRPILAGGLTALLALATASAASAAQIAPLLPCERAVSGSVRSIHVRGVGFAPNATVQLKTDGQPYTSVTTDASGNFGSLAGGVFSPLLTPPSFRSPTTFVQTFSLTAEDGSTTAPAVPLTVSKVAVTLPSRAKPRTRVRYRVFGFLGGKRVYLHVYRHGLRRTVGLGTAKGDCGTLSKRLAFLPLRRYSTGTYTYYFSQHKRFSRKTAIYLIKLRIFKVLRPRRLATDAGGASAGEVISSVPAR